MAGLVLTCGYIALFLYLIGRLPFFSTPGLGRKAIGAIFLLKVAAGTAVWWIYSFHYPDRATADIFKFFDDGNVMFGALRSHPLDYLRMITGIGNDSPHFDQRYYSVMNNWYRRYETGYHNDAHTMIRFSALVRIFSFGVYHVHTVFACFLSLTGLVALYKTFAPRVAGAEKAWAAGLFLWPSMLFWGSAPIKEALLLFGLGLFLLQLFRLMHGTLRWHGWLWLLLGLLVQLSLKSYVLACMLPGLAALWWCRRKKGRPIAVFAAAYTAAAAAVVVLPWLWPGADVVAAIQQKQRDMLGLVAEIGAGSFVPTTTMEPGLWGLVREIPHALFLSFISPLLTWNLGAMGLVGGLENLALLALLPLGLLWRKAWRQVDLPLFLFCICFVLAMALLIGWTTPVVGALMRYRVPMLPFYTLAFLLFTRPITPRALFQPGK